MEEENKTDDHPENAEPESDLGGGDSVTDQQDSEEFRVLIGVDQSHHSEDAFRCKYRPWDRPSVCQQWPRASVRAVFICFVCIGYRRFSSFSYIYTYNPAYNPVSI